MLKYSIAAALLFPACLASANITANISTDTSSVAGVVQNRLTIDTDIDWVSAAVFADLSTGTLHNPNSLVPGYETFENAPGSGDTYVYANGSSTGIAGGAGDLGHVHPLTPGAAEFSPTTLGVAWFGSGASRLDIGTALPLGQFSFSDDAAGTWALMIVTADDASLNLSGTIDQGAFITAPMATFMMVPEYELTTTRIETKDKSGKLRVSNIISNEATGNFYITRPYMGTTTIEPWHSITNRTLSTTTSDLGSRLPEPGSLLIGGFLASLLVINRRS